MMHPYLHQDYPKEHQNDLLKEGEINRMLQRRGSKRVNRFGLVNVLVGKVENLLASARVRLSERSLSPFGGKLKEA